MTRVPTVSQFEADLRDSGRSYSATLDKGVALNLLRATHDKLYELGYKPARDLALEKELVVREFDENLWDAYKDFIDRRFQRRAQSAIKIKHRPFAPLDAA